MLKNIAPLLTGPLLQILCDMGHGDEIAIVDANFPACSLARRLHRMDGVNSVTALQTILTVFPLDDFGGPCAWCMQVVGVPLDVAPISLEFRSIVTSLAPAGDAFSSLERLDFYTRASAAFAIVATGETRLYGNILLRKGVVSA